VWRQAGIGLKRDCHADGVGLLDNLVHGALSGETVSGWGQHGRPRIKFWLNEEAALEQLPVNSLATMLWRTYDPSVVHELLCGAVIITGAIDNAGAALRAPVDVIETYRWLTKSVVPPRTRHGLDSAKRLTPDGLEGVLSAAITDRRRYAVRKSYHLMSQLPPRRANARPTYYVVPQQNCAVGRCGRGHAIASAHAICPSNPSDSAFWR
jgi:hypothetical protein